MMGESKLGGGTIRYQTCLDVVTYQEELSGPGLCSFA